MLEALEEFSHLRQFLDTSLTEKKPNSSVSDCSHQLTPTPSSTVRAVIAET